MRARFALETASARREDRSALERRFPFAGTSTRSEVFSRGTMRPKKPKCPRIALEGQGQVSTFRGCIPT